MKNLPVGESRETKEATERELRIISPSFSGSTDSLATLLRAWIHDYITPPKVRIVSGSATSINKNDLLEKIGWEVVRFQTTVVHVEEANDKFYKYLSGLDPQSKRDNDPHIALLSETSTGHGQTVRSESEDMFLSLTFPLHISQLRVEAERQRRSRDEAANTLVARDSGLALPMREAGSPASKDIVPLFSPVETVTMELALDGALSAIHRERIRYVGVMSTDVQDRIFLVREIRKHCPNAMIFIQTDDLLYLHSESNLDFQGALVISSYPLFGLNQLWTYPFTGGKSRLQFSTYTAQGVYNATLALLNKEGQTPEDRIIEDRMLEYGFPLKQYKDGENRYPALWLGIIGRNGIWPVKTFDIGTLKITKQSWVDLKESLKSKSVPPDVFEKLGAITDQEFNGEEQFLNKLKEMIGDSQTDQFKELFLQHARNSYTLAVKHKASRSQSDEQKKFLLGLSGNYWSPTGIGILLLVGGICLFLPLVFLIQSILYWGRSKVDKANPDQWREGQASLGRAIIDRILGLEREITEGNVRTSLRRLFAWVRRGWPGQVFGDEEFYCYRPDRRVYLMSCCVSLVTVTLFISSVAMLPVWIRGEVAIRGETMYEMMKVPSLGNISGALLMLTAWIRWAVAKDAFKKCGGRTKMRSNSCGIRIRGLSYLLARFLRSLWPSSFWLAGSIVRRMMSGRGHFRWRIGAWLTLGVVVAMIAFVIRWDKDLALGVIAVMILAIALAAFFWLAGSLIHWMIRGRPHFHGRIGVFMSLVVGAAMIMFVGLGLYNVFCSFEKPERVFFFLRATELSSGVSVLLPALLIGLATFLSFFAALRRLNLAERMPCLRGPQQRSGDAPQFLRFDHEGAKSFQGSKVLEDRVKEMIVCRIIELPGAMQAAFVILILYWVLFLHYFIPSVDGRWFDWFFRLGFYVAPMLLAWAFLRFVWLWAALRRLLRRLAWHPLISQYAAERSEESRFASLPPVDLMTHTPTYTALSASAQQARSFYNALKLPPKQAETGERIRRLVEKAETKLSLAFNFDAQGRQAGGAAEPS